MVDTTSGEPPFRRGRAECLDRGADAHRAEVAIRPNEQRGRVSIDRTEGGGRSQVMHHQSGRPSALLHRAQIDDRVPLLIIHGADDEEVPATEAMAFATKLALLKKRYQLMVYANDIHEVAINRLDRDARIVAWFREVASGKP